VPLDRRDPPQHLVAHLFDAGLLVAFAAPAPLAEGLSFRNAIASATVTRGRVSSSSAAAGSKVAMPALSTIDSRSTLACRIAACAASAKPG
jgi:hypothetical protein